MDRKIRVALAVIFVLAGAAPPAARALDIVPQFIGGMQYNADAKAAFNRAAGQWETLFTDPITVNIVVDFATPTKDDNWLAYTNSVEFSEHYAIVRQLLIDDAQGYADNGIVNYLPENAYQASLPAGWTLDGEHVKTTSANFKALGYIYLNYGDKDADIRFASTYTWDYDRSDGIGETSYDFEGVAAHEIGHALGFFSNVEDIDWYLSNKPGQAYTYSGSLMDLFRFSDGAVGNPSTSEEFRTMSRNLVPGTADNFDDTVYEFPMATGKTQGDGAQAHHFKEGWWWDVNNPYVGIMVPYTAAGTITNIWPTDARVLDLMGWDLADLTVKYDYTYTYQSGDYYSGSVYADVRDIYPFSPLQFIDENGSMGSYIYTPVAYYQSTPDKEILEGTVYIDKYVDHEAKMIFEKRLNGDPLGYGTQGLGSEKGYIVETGVDQYFFGHQNPGEPAYEADLDHVMVKWHYYYTYANGDQYDGYFYDFATDPRPWGEANDEHGKKGSYKIYFTNDFYYQPPWYMYLLLNKVSVDKYFDKESGKTYTQRSNGDALGGGTQGLGSEKGYIIQEGVEEFFFGYQTTGGAVFEADLPRAYSFTHHYASGDTYSGSFYASPDFWPYSWPCDQDDGKQFFPTIDESGGQGYYTFTPENLFFEYGGLFGLVTVKSYYDSQSGNTYHAPFMSNLATGSNGLGSERGFIIQDGVYQFLFGGCDFDGTVITFEANLLYRQQFTYYYSDGDYYTGYVVFDDVASANVDFLLHVKDEHGPGYYTFNPNDLTFIEDPNVLGQVEITTYFDHESGRWYTAQANGAPLGGGTQGLGSEQGYIGKAGVDEFFFGYKAFQDTDFEADLSAIYRYTCYLGGGQGDSYSGVVYASPDHGYRVGMIFDVGLGKDENGQPAFYKITGVSYSSGDPTGTYGFVYVESYHDAESGRDFEPMNSTVPLGTAYLGSEAGYIIQEGVPQYYFGGAYYEADLTFVSNFRFTFIHSDSYTGKVYALPDAGYRAGVQITVPEGTYEILDDGTPVLEADLAGQVFVDKYFNDNYDGTWAEYATVSQGLVAVGTDGLGTEHDYVLLANIPEYRFGADMEITNPETVCYAYDFKFAYSNGDWYEGVAYAKPEQGYTTAYTLTLPVEFNQSGTYTIRQTTAGADINNAGRVYVSKYHDAESGRDYAPVNYLSPLGSSYLGSESGYIIKTGTPDFYFGKGSTFQYEADLAACYSYKFIYNDGKSDYYIGTVYASQDHGYYVGDIFSTSLRDENQHHSYYQITGVSYLEDASKYGQVTVASYYDKEMNKTYVPTFTFGGKNYLGSEYGLINVTDYPGKFNPALGAPPGIAKFYFGGGYYEADVKETDKLPPGQTKVAQK